MKVEISDLERLPSIGVFENLNEQLKNSPTMETLEVEQNLSVKAESECTAKEMVCDSDDGTEMEMPLSAFLTSTELRSDSKNMSATSKPKKEKSKAQATTSGESLSNEFESIDCNDVESLISNELHSESTQNFISNTESSDDNSDLDDPIEKADDIKSRRNNILQPRVRRKYRTKPKLPKQNKFDENIGKYFQKLKCQTCSVLVDNFKDLKQHTQTTHNLSAAVECCKKNFTTRRQLYNHVLIHLNATEFKCTICTKSFKDNSALQEHIKRHQCDQCSRIFADIKNLRQHKLLVHLTHSEYSFACKECDAKFPVKRKLTYHLRTAHGLENPFICDKCGKNMRNAYSLKKHMASHSEYAYLKGDPVQCNDCGKWLKHSSSLTGHKLYVHGDLQTCTICNKTLKTVRELRDHMNIHTKEKVFTCEVCSKTFKTRATLREHVKHIHSSNPTLLRKQCGTCGLWFFTSKTLRTHIRNLHSKKSNQCACPICGMMSVHQWALKRHIKLRHGSEPVHSNSEKELQLSC